MIVWASAAVSLDGYIDDTTSRRLVLSGTKDWEQVRALRAECDAVLVGAETIRKDNPALVTRSEKLREKRTAQGKPADPVKVTVSASGRLDPQARFFSEGTGRKIVIAGTEASPEHLAALRRVATVIVAKTDPITPETILQLLSQEGIRTLFIEGGTRILTQFLTADAIDYLRMATAPFFVGDSHAPRFVHAGRFPHNKDRRMHLLSTQAIGDMSVAIYALKASAEDYARMEQAITLAAQCPPSKGAYSVGAVIVTEDGQVFTGYSRETAPTNHAEEEAILKAIRAGQPAHRSNCLFQHGALYYTEIQTGLLLRTDHPPLHETGCVRRIRTADLRHLPRGSSFTASRDRGYHPQRPCTKSTGCQPTPREITDNTCIRFNFCPNFSLINE